ncbi:MAG: hypothetical protein ACOCV2_07510 [Persicimonas sp.]
MAAAAVFLFAGCATTSEEPLPDGIDEMNRAEVLYTAIVETYEANEIPIELSSKESLLVTSEPEQEESDLRKSINTRVVPVTKGATALRVRTEWEERATVDGEEVWQPVDSQKLRERSKGDEIALARDIEQRYERWEDQVKADQKRAES